MHIEHPQGSRSCPCLGSSNVGRLTCERGEDAEHAADADVVGLAGALELVVRHLHQAAGHNDDALLLRGHTMLCVGAEASLRASTRTRLPLGTAVLPMPALGSGRHTASKYCCTRHHIGSPRQDCCANGVPRRVDVLMAAVRASRSATAELPYLASKRLQASIKQALLAHRVGLVNLGAGLDDGQAAALRDLAEHRLRHLPRRRL